MPPSGISTLATKLHELIRFDELNIILLRKVLQNEKLTGEELQKLETLQKSFEILKNGGSVGTTKKHLTD